MIREGRLVKGEGSSEKERHPGQDGPGVKARATNRWGTLRCGLQKIFPGFISPFGSKSALMRRIHS